MDEVYSLHEHDGTMIVRLAAQARVDAAIVLHQRLLQTEVNLNVAVDWSQAEHVDASVLQVFLGLQKSLAQRGLSLTVSTDNPRVREYLEYSGLSDRFPVQSPQAPSPAGG